MISFRLQCCQDCRVIVDVSESYPRRDAAMSHTVFEDRSLCSCISSVFLISFSGIISASRFRSFTVHECHRCQWKPLFLMSFVYSVLTTFPAFLSCLVSRESLLLFSCSHHQRVFLCSYPTCCKHCSRVFFNSRRHASAV